MDSNFILKKEERKKFPGQVRAAKKRRRSGRRVEVALHPKTGDRERGKETGNRPESNRRL